LIIHCQVSGLFFSIESFHLLFLSALLHLSGQRWHLPARHPGDADYVRLLRADTRFPLDWNDQRRFFASA
jgi:hypothetical protein